MSRAVIVVNGNYDRDRASQWAKSAPSGCIIEFRQSKRSVDQNSRLWACLTEIARKVEWHGMKLPADDWKDIFTAALRKHRFVPGLDANTVVPLGMRTSDMTKQEFSDLLELINAFAAEHGVEFQDHQSSDTPSPSDEGSNGAMPPGHTVAADLSDAGNGVDEGEAEQPEAEDSPAASSASPVLSDEDRAWLIKAVKMLVPCATPGGDIGVVRAQYSGLIKSETPATISELAIAKAVAICKRLVAVCEQSEELDRDLIAGLAGCDVSEVP